LLKYVVFDGNTAITQEYGTASSTLHGHVNAAGTIAVGAAPYWLTLAYGSAIPRLQAFSSWGVTPTLFDLNGNPKNAVWQKPEISAPNGGNTTFFGNDIPNTIPDDTDTFPNFFGTSAAAPGVAALMLDACSIVPLIQKFVRFFKAWPSICLHLALILAPAQVWLMPLPL
jgi:hypothetical protein